MKRSLVYHTRARVARALARYLAQPVSHPAASGGLPHDFESAAGFEVLKAPPV